MMTGLFLLSLIGGAYHFSESPCLLEFDGICPGVIFGGAASSPQLILLLAAADEGKGFAQFLQLFHEAIIQYLDMRPLHSH